MNKIKILSLNFICVFMQNAFGQTSQPKDILKNRIDKVIMILKAPEYQGDSNKTEQKEKIWEVIRQVFDFNEMSRRTTAQYWRKFSNQRTTQKTKNW